MSMSSVPEIPSLFNIAMNVTTYVHNRAKEQCPYLPGAA